MADYEALPPAALGDKPEEEETRCSCKVLTGFLVVLGLIAGIVWIYMEHEDAAAAAWQHFLVWCKSLGWGAAVVVCLATWLATSIGLPASVFFVGSAAIFSSLYGPTKGAVVAISACGLGFWAGCVSAFALARSLLKGTLQKKMGEFEALRAVNIIIEEEGWRFAFLMRLSPFMPVEVFNFACALTSMTFSQNCLACLGSLPVASFEIWMYCQVAHAAMQGRNSHKEDNSNQLYIMIAINIPICIILFLVIRHANKKYHDKVDKFPADNIPKDLQESLKDRKDLHSKLRKASTMRAASQVIGTSQAAAYAKTSLNRARTIRMKSVNFASTTPRSGSVSEPVRASWHS